MTQKERENYDGSNIQVLEGLEAVRKRPGMYIGSTSEVGLHHLVWEITDNANDEHLAGFGDVIVTRIHSDGSLSVQDRGRGIPVDLHSTGKPTLEVVLTVLHAGGKFGGGGYKVSGGLHGVGASVTNALSKKLTATVVRDGKKYIIEFERGKTTRPMECLGDTDEESGTFIHFYPDPLIFKQTTTFDFATICKRLRETAFLNPKLRMVVIDERETTEEGEFLKEEYYFEEGLKSYVNFLNQGKKPLHESIFYLNKEKDNVQVQVAFQYTQTYNKDGVVSFANNVKTPEGGAHDLGFKTALSSVIKEYISMNNLMKNDATPDAEDTRVGLTAIVSVHLEDPEFEGQTKGRLGSSYVRPIVTELVNEALQQFLIENPDETKGIVKKIVDSYEERMAARKARQETRAKKVHAEDEHLLMPSKLTDCSSNVVSECEVYIVEGDSAGGSAKQGRDRVTQAILALRGKILNTEKAKMSDMLKNAEIASMASGFGCGYGDNFDYDSRRYDKIIIMTDADVDGAHIRTLLLTFFYRFMRPLIERGNIYIAQPPLYAVKGNKDKLLGYAYNEKELAELKEKHPRASVQRYKGLGEMNAEQLWDTTMDPEKRILIRVSIENAEQCDWLFTTLMGEDTEGRKEYIDLHGHKAEINS